MASSKVENREYQDCLIQIEFCDFDEAFDFIIPSFISEVLGMTNLCEFFTVVLRNWMKLLEIKHCPFTILYIFRNHIINYIHNILYFCPQESIPKYVDNGHCNELYFFTNFHERFILFRTFYG